MKLLKDFQEISGLKTNVDKTIAYRLGKLNVNDPPANLHGLSWKTLPISLLGITRNRTPNQNLEQEKSVN